MRRPAAFAAAFTAAAALSYLTGPDILRYIYDSNAQKPAPDASTAGTEPGEDATLAAEGESRTPPPAPARPVARVPELAAGKTEPRAATRPHVPLRRKARPIESTPDTAAVTGLEHAKADMRPSAIVHSADPTRSRQPQRNLSNPMDDRWIDGLSGQRAKLSMGVARKDTSCPAGACERPEAPKDISLAGVVVKSQKLLRPGPTLDGEIARGHYKDKTPAVYVE